MKRIFYILLLAICLGLSSMVCAQDEPNVPVSIDDHYVYIPDYRKESSDPSQTEYIFAERKPKQYLNLRYKDAKLGEVIKEITRLTGYKFAISPQVFELPITINVKNKQWIAIVEDFVERYKLVIEPVSEESQILRISKFVEPVQPTNIISLVFLGTFVVSFFVFLGTVLAMILRVKRQNRAAAAV